jgi:RNA polymerase sigma-70 factor (ECF subfamily)
MSTTPLLISVADQHYIINTSKITVSCLFNNEFIKSKNYFSQADIDDIANETVLKVCRSYHRFNPERAKLSTWIRKIAYNCIVDAIQDSIKRQFVDKDCEFVAETRDMISEYNAEKELCRKEFEERVEAACSHLSEKNRRFKNLLVLEYAPREMAEIEGCTPNAASKRVWDIRNALQEPLSAIASEFEFYDYKKAC